MNERHLDQLLAIYDDLAPDERRRVDDAMAERPHLAAKLATYRAQDRALDDFARFQARRLDPKWSDEMNTQSMLAAQPATQRGPTARLHTPRVDGWLHRLLHSPVTAFQFAAMSAVLVMLVSISLLLAGVEPPSALTAAFGQATPTPEAAEPVEVTGEGVVRFLCGYNSPNDCSAYNELVEQFEAEHPDVQVELVRRQSIPGLAGPSGGPLAQEVLDDVAARVDVGLGWLFLVGNSDPSRSLVDLAPYIEAQPGMSRADFFPGVLDGPQDDDSVWALPTSFAPVLLYYNKNIFDKAGVPYPTAAWTQADFLRAAEQLTKRDGERITQAGFADPLGQGRNLFVDAALSTQGISGLTSPALVEAVHWYTALQTEHRVMRDLPETFGRISVEARGAINAGNVAMWVDSPLYPIVSRRPTSGNPMDWGVTDVPSPYAPTGLFFGEGFAISAQAAEPAAAWQWIEFLSRHPIDIEPPSDSEYAMPQGFPTRRSVAEATDFWRYWTEQERADIENALTELASQGERWNERAYNLSEGLYTAYGIINQNLLANDSVDVREALAQAQAQLGVTLQTREQTPIDEQSMLFDPAPYAYTMQEGDTLYRVATRYASRVEWIVEANKLADANDFQVGDELIIPNARVFVGEAGAPTGSAIRPAPITVGYANLEADATYALYRSRQDSAPLIDAMRGAELEQSLRLPVVARSEDSAWLRVCCYNGELVWLAAADVTVENLEDAPVVAMVTGELTGMPVIAPEAQPTVQEDELQAVDFAHGIELYPHDDSIAMFDAVLEASQYFGWVKRDVPWSRFHPDQRLSVDYAELTQFVRGVERHDVNVLLTMTLRPELARDRGRQPVAGPVGEFDVLAAELGEMAERYCGTAVQAIEVWDEQNLHYSWSDENPDAEAYMDLLRDAHDAIKEACPSMLVISGGLTPAGNHREGIAVDDFEYFETMLQNGLARYADGIGVHLPGYNVPSSVPFEEACAATTEDAVTFDGPCESPHHSWSFASTLAGYQELLDAYNVDLPLWPTELGWGAGTALDDRYRYVDDNTREEQAAWTLEAFDLLREAGTGPAFLYNFDETMADPESGPAQWSILDAGGEPLPVYDALREQLSGETEDDLPPVQTSRCRNEAAQIVSPQRGEVISGVVEIRGTATRPIYADDFSGYRLGWVAGAYSEGEGEWKVEGDKAVEDDVLGTLNSSELPSGPVTLRLISMDDSTRVAVCEVVVEVQN